MRAKVYEFPDHRFEIRRPLSASPDATFFALRINDDSFVGDLRRGQIVVIEENAISLPGFHAVRLCSGLVIVRYALELPGGRVRLLSGNPEYPIMEIGLEALAGRVRQMKLGENGELWELIDQAALPSLIVEWLLSGEDCEQKKRR